MTQTTQLRFGNPPVRKVRLTFFFAADTVRVSDVISLLERWRSEFPIVEESAPLPPLSSTDEFIPIGDSNWPLPFMTLADSDGLRTLLFQGDRFGVEWNFDETSGADYPGFDDLRQSLEAKYSELVDQLAQANSKIVTTGVEVQYRNLLPGLTTNDYVVGLLSNWSVNAAELSGEPDESTVYSRHFHPDMPGDAATWMSARSDDEGSCELVFTVRTMDIPENSHNGALEAAHDIATTMLVSHTSDELRRSWLPQ